ncbi:transcriptional regulator [Actinoplanes sp. NBRC 101535]|uniref:transcriptional regulator n=1 Tax=Actinoplanes sp. NBRC 101535 TaxID=3032196 RepID=UPI0024A5927C|nr:transcriptional regulator [Actinoplanes sp. NBRC 101535]GLY00432.1 hypothetical protein Acsp01_08110 [Actinoplanes sp. NBRC 101535]
MSVPVLHALRCMGFAESPRIAGACGAPEAEVESQLIDLAVAGLVTRTPGGFGGWGLTGAGKREDARRVHAEVEAAGARAALTAGYQRFLVLNPELLDLCSAWHLRPGAAGDAGYDARVIGRFADLDRRAAAVCRDLSAALPRFATYRVRLGDALARAQGGEVEHLTDSMTSYHSVWFQWHEDLLCTLGIPR